eukprot:5847771-Amphidinium_carterae.1
MLSVITDVLSSTDSKDSETNARCSQAQLIQMLRTDKEDISTLTTEAAPFRSTGLPGGRSLSLTPKALATQPDE